MIDQLKTVIDKLIKIVWRVKCKEIKIIISASHLDDTAQSIKQLITRSTIGKKIIINLAGVSNVHVTGWELLMRLFRISGRRIALAGTTKSIRETITFWQLGEYFECA